LREGGLRGARPDDAPEARAADAVGRVARDSTRYSSVQESNRHTAPKAHWLHALSEPMRYGET
jgi:hypothetical protein